MQHEMPRPTLADLDQRWAALRDFVGELTPVHRNEIRHALAKADFHTFVGDMSDSAVQIVVRGLALAALDEAERRLLNLLLDVVE